MVILAGLVKIEISDQKPGSRLRHSIQDKLNHYIERVGKHADVLKPVLRQRNFIGYYTENNGKNLEKAAKITIFA